MPRSAYSQNRITPVDVISAPYAWAFKATSPAGLTGRMACVIGAFMAAVTAPVTGAMLAEQPAMAAPAETAKVDGPCRRIAEGRMVCATEALPVSVAMATPMIVFVEAARPSFAAPSYIRPVGAGFMHMNAPAQNAARVRMY